ncbi:MAG: vanadium-dependent haloperoxidase [Bacteroidota bacterium]
MLMIFGACEPDPSQYEKEAQNPEIYHQTVKQLTDIIVYDIFSPPVASRIYAYPNVAAYEIMAQNNPGFESLAGQLTDLTPIPAAEPEILAPLAALYAFTEVGHALIFSIDKMEAYQLKLRERYTKLGVPESKVEASMNYGSQVAKHILEWADKDNYKQTRTFPKYTVNASTAGRWTPTPPDYMDGIEPHWNQIRPFIIDSATQFIPNRPPAFDLDPQSTFYQDLMEVYETVNKLNDEQEAIAQFWDCNPYVTHHQGHVMFATKKITPGGHWIGIVKEACQEAEADWMTTLEAYTRTSLALADAFISCWDEKYRSNLIRPETVINQHIDEEWRPLLQTPPFPEYTSGHSVISRAAAVTLTGVFGDGFAFVDSSEVEYGLPVRSYDSFLEASEEAAISRLYGGIHYMPAIEQGVAQGELVGEYVVKNLVTRKSQDISQN